MKKKFLIPLFFIAVCVSCKKDKTSEETTFTPDCSGSAPTYAATVSGIISSNCAASGCHAAGSNNGPGALTTYTQVKNAAVSIRSAVLNGSMPKNGSLTNAQKNNIICWIDAGAINN